MKVKLLVMQGRPAGKALIFGPGEYYLGRGEECHVRFNSEWVSRQHCLLQVRSDRAVLSDLGSRNGTLVNGQLVRKEWLLCEGDQLQIGPVLFEVQFEPPTPETSAESSLPEMIWPADQDSTVGEVGLDSTAHQPALPPDYPKGQGNGPT
jgi:pSer/pThr/pTyr-binding forkhead associated (FHA) protein